MDHVYAVRIFRAVSVGDAGRAVGRAVVHDHDPLRDRKHAVDGLAEQLLLIVRGHDNRNGLAHIS